MKQRYPTGWKALLATVAAVVAFLAALPSVVEVGRTTTSWMSDVVTEEPKPSRAEAGVARFVREMRRKVPWQQQPTIFKPSLDYFRRHYAALDPKRTHELSLKGVRVVADVGTVATRAPLVQGHLIAIRARAEQIGQVTTYGAASSWAYRLYDHPRDRVAILCRVPFSTFKEPDVRPGAIVYATGVLIGDGGIEDGEGKPARIFYMACSALDEPMTIAVRKPGSKQGSPNASPMVVGAQ